ncbi:MAG: dethiobiotin synthase [Gammaproteobacteria bacterium]
MAAQGIFVTGTDTAVGKTLVAGALLRALSKMELKACGFKPVAAGASDHGSGLRNPDAELLLECSSPGASYQEVNPILVEAAIAPHIGLEQEGRRFEMTTVTDAFQALASRFDFVVVEGAGGWLVPLDEKEDMASLAARLGLPVILVVGVRLGCISHSRLSVEAIRSRGLELAGWVGSCLEPDMPALPENLKTLDEVLDAPRLGLIPWLEQDDEVEKATGASLVFDHKQLRHAIIRD